MTTFGRTDVQPVIQVRDLTMAYGDVEVLRGVDLDIHRGEVFALLGPNGSDWSCSPGATTAAGGSPSC